MTEREKRTLYVGEMVSWDAQWSHAVNLFNKGASVTIHDHAPDDRCRLDGARCKCGTLTDEGGDVSLELFGLIEDDKEADN